MPLPERERSSPSGHSAVAALLLSIKASMKHTEPEVAEACAEHGAMRDLRKFAAEFRRLVQ